MRERGWLELVVGETATYQNTNQSLHFGANWCFDKECLFKSGMVTQNVRVDFRHTR